MYDLDVRATANGMLGVALLCGSCQVDPDTVVASDTEADASSETDAGTGTEGGDEDPGEDPGVCGCVFSGGVCEGWHSVWDCTLPDPCPNVTDNSDEEAATCVLNLLVEQEPARFFYKFREPTSLGHEEWAGWFYILGPGEGIDGECHSWQHDFHYGEDVTVARAQLETPAYFADCIGKSLSVMNGCIFNGIDVNGAQLAECN